MGNMKFFDDIIDQKLLGLNTAYIAKVISYKDGKADLQPLNMIKLQGKSAQKPSVVKSAPVLLSARNKIGTKEINYVYNSMGATKNETIVTLTPLSAGDLVFCVCADRDITEAKKGKMATPCIGHHSLSDTVVVGML